MKPTMAVNDSVLPLSNSATRPPITPSGITEATMRVLLKVRTRAPAPRGCRRRRPGWRCPGRRSSPGGSRSRPPPPSARPGGSSVARCAASTALGDPVGVEARPARGGDGDRPLLVLVLDEAGRGGQLQLGRPGRSGSCGPARRRAATERVERRQRWAGPARGSADADVVARRRRRLAQGAGDQAAEGQAHRPVASRRRGRRAGPPSGGRRPRAGRCAARAAGCRRRACPAVACQQLPPR